MDARDYPEAYLEEEPIEPRGTNKEVIKLRNQVVKLTAQRDELMAALETFLKQYPAMTKGYLLDALAKVKGETE